MSEMDQTCTIKVESKKILNADDVEILDELNKTQIDQLHKATLNFSDNSLGTLVPCTNVVKQRST